MKKSLSLFASAVFFLTGNQPLSAQDDKTVAGKLIYFELGGPGVVMSAHYDARFDPESRLGFGYRIGAGFGYENFEEAIIELFKEETDMKPYFDDIKRPFYSIPAGLNYVLGKPHISSTVEIGAGVTFLTRKASLYNYEMYKPGHVIGFFTCMYRFAPVNGGFTFRIGFTPIIGTAGDLFPMGAIGFGYAF